MPDLRLRGGVLRTRCPENRVTELETLERKECFTIGSNDWTRGGPYSPVGPYVEDYYRGWSFARKVVPMR